ncbi:MAG: hypothetical protein E6G97_18125 [Alphaproteobacteria bacterium]|nr:MAG: hypothetical protein E6G97_18125 [Alphaproteobacteria bacterium]
MSPPFDRCDNCGGQLGHFKREAYLEKAVCLACGLKHFRDLDDHRMFNAPYRSTHPVDLVMSLPADDTRAQVSSFHQRVADSGVPVLLPPAMFARPLEADAERGPSAPAGVCQGDYAEMFTLAFLLIPGQAPRMIAAPGFSRPISEHIGDERAFLAPLVQAAVLQGAQRIAREVLGQGPLPLRDLDRGLLEDMGFKRYDSPSRGDYETWAYDGGTPHVQFFDGEIDLPHWAINGRGLSRKDFFAWFLRELKTQVVDDARENMT